MAETLNEQKSPEERVFGNAFSLKNGVNSPEAKEQYFMERISMLRDGQTVWVSRSMDSDGGIVADLFKAGKVVALLEFDYSMGMAYVYATSEGGQFGDITLANETSFDTAVNEAEKFAENIS